MTDIKKLSEVLAAALVANPAIGGQLSTLLGASVAGGDPGGNQPELTMKQRKQIARETLSKKARKYN